MGFDRRAFFRSTFLRLLYLLPGRRWTHLATQSGRRVNHSDGLERILQTDEPTVTEVTPGRLLMFIRNELGRVFQAWSEDNGETWSRLQPTSLASSTVPAQIRTLTNGHLLAVWNQESEEEIKQGYNRTRISSAISRNGGSVGVFPERRIDSREYACRAWAYSPGTPC